MKLLAALLLAVAFTAPAAEPVPLPQVGAGRVERLADFASKYVPARNVDVWLPPGYPAQAPYAVLYMHDGQMLFDAAHTWNHQEWRVDEVASALMAQHKVRPFIVVGIWNAGPLRMSEYFPQKPWEALTPAQQTHLYKQKQGEAPLLPQPPYADRYLEFLVEELKPFIDHHYAVDPRPQSTFTMGSSMGALVSMYALAEYPRVFGGAACMSTHWPGASLQEDPANPGPAAFQAYIAAHFPPPGAHRIYFDHGTQTLDALYADRQAKVDAILRAKGYGPADFESLAFPGADHSEKSWAARLDRPLVFLLGPPPDSAAAH